MLRKGVYRYNYMDSWQRINETSLPDKKEKIFRYELDSAHFLSVPGLAWQACLKKTEIELEL